MLITPARPACPFLWPSWNVHCLGRVFSNSPKHSLHCPLFSRGIRRTPVRYALSADEAVFANLPLRWAGCSSRQQLPGAWLRTWPVRGAPWTFLDTPRPPEFILSAHSASNCRGCHLLQSEWLRSLRSKPDMKAGLARFTESGQTRSVSPACSDSPREGGLSPWEEGQHLHHHPRKVM